MHTLCIKYSGSVTHIYISLMHILCSWILRFHAHPTWHCRPLPDCKMLLPESGFLVTYSHSAHKHSHSTIHTLLCSSLLHNTKNLQLDTVPALARLEWCCTSSACFTSAIVPTPTLPPLLLTCSRDQSGVHVTGICFFFMWYFRIVGCNRWLALWASAALQHCNRLLLLCCALLALATSSTIVRY